MFSKLMEILNMKKSFQHLPEISVLGHSFFSLCFEQGNSLFFFSAVSFFSLSSIILYVFLSRVTELSKRPIWKLMQFTLEENMSKTRSDSGVWRIRRQLQYLVSCTPQLHIPYPTAFPYWNGMVLHFYQQQESSTTKTVHKVINKRLKTYV